MARTAEQRAKHREYMRARREKERAAQAATSAHADSHDSNESVNRPSVLAATQADIALLSVPAGHTHLVASALALAEILDDASRAPQFATIAARLSETMAMLSAVAKPVEVDPLDDMRRAFYTGRVADIGADPEE